MPLWFERRCCLFLFPLFLLSHFFLLLFERREPGSLAKRAQWFCFTSRFLLSVSFALLFWPIDVLLADG